MANPNLKMPYILPGQVQKHVTHEALRLLDAVVHLSVKSRNRAEAPEHLSVGYQLIQQCRCRSSGEGEQAGG